MSQVPAEDEWAYEDAKRAETERVRDADDAALERLGDDLFSRGIDAAVHVWSGVGVSLADQEAYPKVAQALGLDVDAVDDWLTERYNTYFERAYGRGGNDTA